MARTQEVIDRAIATRSLNRALRLTGDERREAMREHFDRVLPAPVCSIRSPQTSR